MGANPGPPVTRRGMKPSLLIVEDDEATLSFLAENLSADGFQVAGATGAAEGVRQIEVRHPAVVLLDLGLADGQRAGAARPRPLGRRPGQPDRPRGAGAGAHRTRRRRRPPARVRARRRRLHRQAVPLRRAAGARARGPAPGGRGGPTAAPCASATWWSTRARARCAWATGPSTCRPRSSRCCRRWPREPDRVVPKNELLRDVWGYVAIGRTRTVDAHACRLRKKLAAGSPRPWIVNVRGVGLPALRAARRDRARAPVRLGGGGGSRGLGAAAVGPPAPGRRRRTRAARRRGRAGAGLGRPAARAGRPAPRACVRVRAGPDARRPGRPGRGPQPGRAPPSAARSCPWSGRCAPPPPAGGRWRVGRAGGSACAGRPARPRCGPTAGAWPRCWATCWPTRSSTAAAPSACAGAGGARRWSSRCSDDGPRAVPGGRPSRPGPRPAHRGPRGRGGGRAAHGHPDARGHHGGGRAADRRMSAVRAPPPGGVPARAGPGLRRAGGIGGRRPGGRGREPHRRARWRSSWPPARSSPAGG